MKTLGIFLFVAAAGFGQTISTIAGTGAVGTDGGKMDQPFGLGIGPDGALYFTEVGNHRISRLDMKTKKLTVVAGTGQKGNAGDGGKATAALLDEPYEIAFNRAGDLFFCDRLAHVVRKIDRRTQLISTVSGTGKEGYSGDGGLAAAAQFKQPHSIVFAPDGSLLICDILNFRIRKVDLKSGKVETWAGTGVTGKAGVEAPMAGTPLAGPRAIAVDKKGNYYLALREGNAIYKMDVKAGRMTLFAGTGQKGFTGDGGPATSATLSGPKGVALAPDGSLYIADTENHAIRKVDTKGVITTLAGTGERGDGPDGDPKKARLARPHGVFVDTKGVVFIGDSENHRIRRVQ